MTKQQKSLSCGFGANDCCSLNGWILLLKRFLYAAILITTSLQHAANAKLKTERTPMPDALMMRIAATPLSIYSKIISVYKSIPQLTTNPNKPSTKQ